MSLLILGGTGFLGRSLAEFFRKGNAGSVLTPTRKDLNLSDRVACQEYIQLHKPDCIIHCAVTISSIDETLKLISNIICLFLCCLTIPLIFRMERAPDYHGVLRRR